MKFDLQSIFKPTGDQPQAIEKLVNNIEKGAHNQVLLGVTGSGKSVVGKTPVFYKDAKGSIHRAFIGDVIDRIFSEFPEKTKIYGESEVIESNDLPTDYQFKTYSFNPDTNSASWKKIKQFTRHHSPKILYKITAQNGSEVTVTGNHNFYVLQNGKIQLVKTIEIPKNSYLPTPRFLPNMLHPLTCLSLETYLLEYPRTYASVKNFTSIYNDFKKESSEFISYRSAYGIMHLDERMKLSVLTALAQHIPQYREHVHVGTIKKGYELPLDLPITDNLMRFLGYYIAEGHATNNYVILSSNDKEVIQDFQKTIATLGFLVFKRPQSYDYQVSSTLIARLLTNWCGSHSNTKHLPDFWMQLSNEHLASLLTGYFSTDGGVDGLAITATTASHSLASDITYALLRFGIQARIRKKIVRLPNRQEKRKYWVISISGSENIILFRDTINFYIETKSNKLVTIIKNNKNTNVDLIPIDGSFIKDLRQQLNLSQKAISKKASIARSYISLLETNKRHPSRSVFRKLLNIFEKFADSKNNPEVLLKILEKKSLIHLFWTPIKKVEKVRSEIYVYDFSVEENETFLAGFGGIFVHNTFTMANVIQKIQKPTLIISHNKTLAGQLYQEFRDFFPNNAVSYFVSYYDYYQPEAYVPTSDTYIEKEAEINEEIDKLRLSATTNLLTRNDVIVVASVSCIYNIGSPVEYGKFILELVEGMKVEMRDILVRLADLQYDRNDYAFTRGTYRVRGNAIDLLPAYMDTGIRMELTEDSKIKSIHEFDPLTGEIIQVMKKLVVYPAKHYMTDPKTHENAFKNIKKDLEQRTEELKAAGKLLEAQRLSQRTNFDLEMIKEVGYVNGIENYSTYFDGRKPGEPPYTLIDYFDHNDKNWLLIIDESHITLPQIRGMYNGDQARKSVLIDYGFRLPSALDNRPLRFDEFMRRVHQAVYVSATPNDFEISLSQEVENGVVEQLIRPTGLVDPQVTVKPTAGQIPDLIEEIKKRVERKERVLVTTLTKRMAEELSQYLEEKEMKVAYLHSDIITLDRQDVLDKLRLGEFDVLVGINLLREGLDLPEVSLVVILDADKEGFLRSRSSLIQTMGRAARNVNSSVIMYADRMTDSMKAAIDEVERRRTIQIAYNTKHGITPQGIKKEVRAKLIDRDLEEKVEENLTQLIQFSNKDVLLPDEREDVIKKLRKEMKTAAERLDFETAMRIRDNIKRLQQK